MIKSKKIAIVTLAKASRPSENGQGDCSASGGGEKEILIPPILLAGSISTASKSKKNARALTDTKLEREVIVDLVGLMTINPREQTWQG